jgi:hypothetical protein
MALIAERWRNLSATEKEVLFLLTMEVEHFWCTKFLLSK